MTKVTVGQPVYGYVPAESAINFSRFLVQNTLRGLVSGVIQVTTNPLGRARNNIVAAALDSQATHILFVDSDMVIPLDCLGRLLAREVDVVSGLYFTRTPPHWPVVSKQFSRPLKPMHDYPPGLTKVWGFGFGLCLVRASVFLKMAEHYKDQNWFAFESNDGEDVWFCNRAAELGINCYLDATVKCGHVGSVMIKESDFLRCSKEADLGAASLSSGDVAGALPELL